MGAKTFSQLVSEMVTISRTDDNPEVWVWEVRVDGDVYADGYAFGFGEAERRGMMALREWMEKQE